MDTTLKLTPDMEVGAAIQAGAIFFDEAEPLARAGDDPLVGLWREWRRLKGAA